MAIRITAHGGVGEIGGNAFIVDDGKSRISLDFGMQFGGPPIDGPRTKRPGQNDFYDSFVRPRAPSAVRDLMTLGLLPEMPDIYRSDVGGTATRPLDGVLLSHPHADHHGHIPYLSFDTPLWMSRVAAYTLAHVQATGLGDVSSQLVDVKPQGTTRRRPKNRKDQPADVQERPISTDARFAIGAWDVERFDVDHSIHGAGAYILDHRDGTRVAYSGDLRLHGRHPERTRRFLKAAEDCDVLLIEGTRVGHGHGHGPAGLGPFHAGPEGRAHGGHDAHLGGDDTGAGTDPGHGRHGGADESRSEATVRDEVLAILERLDDDPGCRFAALAYPLRDMDRVQSLHEARRDRVFLIQPRQAHLLWHLRTGCGLDFLPDPFTDPGIRIHVPEPVEEREAWDDPQQELPLADWTRSMYFRHFEENRIRPDRVVTNADIAAEPEAYLLTLNYFNIHNLIDILPKGAGGVFIRSQTQPFNDEMLLVDQKLRLWLDVFRLRHESTHVSGHIGEAELFAALEEVRPKHLIPIHSEHPEKTIHHAGGLGIPSTSWRHGQTITL